MNSRLDEIQAAVLRAKLPHLDGWTERRREIASRYGGARVTPLEPLAELADRRHVFHLYVVRAPIAIACRPTWGPGGSPR